MTVDGSAVGTPNMRRRISGPMLEEHYASPVFTLADRPRRQVASRVGCGASTAFRRSRSAIIRESCGLGVGRPAVRREAHRRHAGPGGHPHLAARLGHRGAAAAALHAPIGTVPLRGHGAAGPPMTETEIQALPLRGPSRPPRRGGADRDRRSRRMPAVACERPSGDMPPRGVPVCHGLAHQGEMAAPEGAPSGSVSRCALGADGPCGGVRVACAVRPSSTFGPCGRPHPSRAPRAVPAGDW